MTYQGSRASSVSHWSRRSFQSHLQKTTSQSQWWWRHRVTCNVEYVQCCVLHFAVFLNLFQWGKSIAKKGYILQNQTCIGTKFFKDGDNLSQWRSIKTWYIPWGKPTTEWKCENRLITDPGLRQDGCHLGFLCRNDGTLISSTLTETELQNKTKELNHVIRECAK